MISKAIGESILKTVPLHQDMLVMDFGAGTGLISSYIAPRVAKIVAVDVSRAMLEKLSQKPDLQGKIKIVCQDIIRAPLDLQVDLIISAMALHHVEDTDLLVGRLFDNLKPGGMVALADLDSEDGSFHGKGAQGVFHLGFDREVLSGIFQDKGFKEIYFETAHVVKKEKDYPVFLLTAHK